MCWRVFEFSVTEQSIIEAPGEVVWRLVREFERYPEFLSAVVAVERLGNDDRDEPIRPGARFRRILAVGKNQQETIVSDVTVIELDDDKEGFPRTFSIYADNFADRMSGRISWTVEATDDPLSTCRLVMHSTLLPKRCCLFLGGCALVPVCLFPKVSSMILQRDIQEFAAEAKSILKLDDTVIQSTDATSVMSGDQKLKEDLVEKVESMPAPIESKTTASARSPAEQGPKEEPIHNTLLTYISLDTSIGRQVRESVETDGYVVIPGVLSEEECQVEMDRLWDFLEAISPGISRNDPESWYPKGSDDEDPWPHSGFGLLPDNFQSYQSGWLFSDLREKLADRVFESLYGTRELHSSKEGFTFLRPNQDNRHPIWSHRPRVCGKPVLHNGEHFDQRAAHTGLQCIQSSTALLDQSADDACFQCWPGSHKEHPRMTRDIWRGRSDWVPLMDSEIEDLRGRGYSPRRVPVKKGDMILWRSDLVHCSAPPLRPSSNFRAVSYTCMLPAALTPPDVANHKLDEYYKKLSGDHRPNVYMPHLSQPKKGKQGKHQTIKGGENDIPVQAKGSYFAQGFPKLTWRQAELYGLVPYGGDDRSEAVVGEDGRLYWAPSMLNC
jgi:hypothetical protein